MLHFPNLPASCPAHPWDSFWPPGHHSLALVRKCPDTAVASGCRHAVDTNRMGVQVKGYFVLGSLCKCTIRSEKHSAFLAPILSSLPRDSCPDGDMVTQGFSERMEPTESHQSHFNELLTGLPLVPSRTPSSFIRSRQFYSLSAPWYISCLLCLIMAGSLHPSLVTESHALSTPGTQSHVL